MSESRYATGGSEFTSNGTAPQSRCLAEFVKYAPHCSSWRPDVRELMGAAGSNPLKGASIVLLGNVENVGLSLRLNAGESAVPVMLPRLYPNKGLTIPLKADFECRSGILSAITGLEMGNLLSKERKFSVSDMHISFTSKGVPLIP
jgi:hypothetical protein